MQRAMFTGMAVMCMGLLILPGCVSSTTGNQQLSSDTVSKITRNVTTRDQVVSMLGEPQHVSLLPDGRRMLMYQGTQNSGNQGGSMTRMIVPFAALFPSTDTRTSRTQMLQIYIGTNNLVQDYEFSDTTSETKTTASAFGAHTDQSTTSNAPASK